MGTDCLLRLPTLDEIAREPSRARDLSMEALASLSAINIAAHSAIAAAQAERLLAGSSNQHASGAVGEDRLLTAEAAAAILAVSKAWLYRRAARLGLSVKLDDGTLRFSSAAVQKLIRGKHASFKPTPKKRS